MSTQSEKLQTSKWCIIEDSTQTLVFDWVPIYVQLA